MFIASEHIDVPTLVLAAATLGLAVVAFAQSRITRRQLQLSIRPLLAEVEPRLNEPTEAVEFGAPGRNAEQLRPDEFFIHPDEFLIDPDQPGMFQVSVPFRNVGSGVAVITGAETIPASTGDTLCSRKFVPPGERVRVNVSALVGSSLSSDFLEALNHWEFAVQISYTDADGGQPLVSRAEIRRYATHRAYVQWISVSRRGKRKPFIVSGPMHG